MSVPFPQTDLVYCLCDRYAKSGVAIEDGDADLDFSDLSFEVTRRERLAQKFHTMHFCFDAASAVVSAPASPKGTTQISLSIDRIVTGNCSGARRLLGLFILARWDHCMRISCGNRFVAFARVICSACGDTADVLINRDLVQKFWQHGSIPDVAAGDLDGPYLQRFFVDAYVYLTPEAALGTTMLAGVPLAFTCLCLQLSRWIHTVNPFNRFVQ